MKRLEEILARCKEIDALQAAIETDAEAKNGGKFTDEQRAEYDKLGKECDDLIAEKKLIESDENRRLARANRAVDLQPAIVQRRVAPETSAPPAIDTSVQTPVDSSGITNGPPQQTVSRVVIPPRALRFGSPRNFAGTVNGVSANERAYRFGMWAMAQIARALPAYNLPQAVDFVNTYMPHNVAHSESDGTTGGHFLVPEEFSSDMIILRERYGVARRLLAREPMMSDKKHIPKRASGLTAYFTGENSAGTESNMTWQDIELSVKDLMILARMSAQLSADAAISVGDTLAGEISYAFAEKEDQCAFNGDGTSTYGGIQGIRTKLTSVDGAGTDSLGLVAQGTGSTWSAITLADFNNVVGLLPQYADTPNACWVTHKTFYAGVMQRLETAAGGVTLQEIAAGDRRPRPMFLGYPVEFSQVFPSATATLTVCAILGDLQLGSVFGDRQQTSLAFSEHASIGSQSVFERNQIAVRGTERFDIVVHGCGTASAVGPIVGLRTAS